MWILGLVVGAVAGVMHGAEPCGCGWPETDRRAVPAVAYGPWTTAFRLTNATMDVVVVPAVGRIVRVALAGGENVLREDPELAATPWEGGAPERWVNLGGDWFWPVAQERWPAIGGSDWPPPSCLGEGAWEGAAWRMADGSMACEMRRTYGEPLNLSVSRTVVLERGRARFRVEQKATRTGASKVPVVLWNVSQVAKPSRVLMASDESSVFPGGYRLIMGEQPGPDQLRRAQNLVIYRTDAGGTHKFGSDSRRGVIAVSRGHLLLVEKVTNTATGPYPDGGCVVEAFSSSDLGYAEIETLSPEVFLKPDESLRNTVTYDLFRIPTICSDEALSELLSVTR